MVKRGSKEKNNIMVSVGTQTDLTAEQIKQMEQSIVKYQEQITQEQNKVQQKETELASLEEEIKDLQTQTKPNFSENYLTALIKDKETWDVSNYKKVKRELVSLGEWNLRRPYIEIRTKLLELVNVLIEGKETREQLEKRNKELEEKLKEGDLNEQEKKLIIFLKEEEEIELIMSNPNVIDEDGYRKERLKRLQNDNEWTQLRDNYEDIRQKLVQLAEKEIEAEKNQQTINDLTQKRDELQTQLDIATKTKEELSEEREIHQDAMKTMDRWYLQRNLELVEENKKKDQKIKELEQQLENLKLENRIEMPPKK